MCGDSQGVLASTVASHIFTLRRGEPTTQPYRAYTPLVLVMVDGDDEQPC